MQDNFNLAKFLRKNPLLNEGIGGYFDLKPLKEMNFDETMGTAMETEGVEGQASLELDWASGMPELKAKCKKHGLTCKVVKENGPGGGNPLVKIMGPKENIIAWLNDGYVNDEEELEMFVADIQDGGMNELEKPEKIYADDDDSEEFGSYQDRIMGLGGDRIESGIISLLDDGFEAEDVMDFCKMIIDAHSQAAAQGRNF